MLLAEATIPLANEEVVAPISIVLPSIVTSSVPFKRKPLLPGA